MKFNKAFSKIDKSEEESNMTAKEENTLKECTTGDLQRFLDQKKQEETQKEVTVKDAAPEISVTPVQSVSEDNLKSETVEQSKEDETSSDEEIATQSDICDSDIDISKANPAPKSDEGLEDDRKEIFRKLMKNLPVIHPDDKKVVLCKKENYRLEMVPVYNADSMIVEKCKLFLVNEETNIPMIGAGAELQIDKSKIATASQSTVFNMIKNYVVNFSSDEIKCAYARAKDFLNKSRSMLSVSYSMNIIEAYRTVIERAKEKSLIEEKDMKSDPNGGRNYEYKPKENKVFIRDKYMKDILEETGYTPTIFCKKLCMAEASMGCELLEHNPGRYSCNLKGNRRYYILCIVDELIGKEVG